MAWEPQRDFIGYGAAPPNPCWPGGAVLAVNFVLNVEEGSEPSVQDGDGFSETNLSEVHGRNYIERGRNLAAETCFEYGSRVGFWRTTRIFAERGMPLTMFACALALERNPEIAAAIRASGYDVCSHGWRWEKHFELSEEEERARIARAMASFHRTLGAAPDGWYCRYGPSVNTRRLVVEHGGFLYDSDNYGVELPFWTTVEGKPHLIVPYTMANNDGKFFGGTATADDWFAFCRDGFDVMLEEGRRGAARMMSIGLHPRIIGQPARAAGLMRLLDHMARHHGVWFARRVDIARHWIATHPYPGKGLGE
jgi:hypothetical protein